MKTGVEAKPGNLLLTQKRLDSLKKKAMKDEDLCVFLTELFHEPQYSNYIEPVDESEAVGNSMWYMPYFVTFSAKKRIVYDGRIDLNGVCKNDFI